MGHCERWAATRAVFDVLQTQQGRAATVANDTARPPRPRSPSPALTVYICGNFWKGLAQAPNRNDSCLASVIKHGEESCMQIGVESSRAVENRRLFVVDDDEITRAALQFMLHDENEAHEVPDVETAFAKSAEMKPDLILLGAGLVRQEGVGVLTLLKERIPGVKLLLVADSSSDTLVDECRQNGADAVLTKPLTIEATRKQVDRLLGRNTRTVIPIYGL